MYKKILLAYDGSESGQNALLDCHEIAQWSQAELTLIAVMPLLAAVLILNACCPPHSMSRLKPSGSLVTSAIAAVAAPACR